MNNQLIQASKLEYRNSTGIYTVSDFTFNQPLPTGQRILLMNENVRELRFLRCTFTKNTFHTIYRLISGLTFSPNLPHILEFESCTFRPEDEEEVAPRFPVLFSSFSLDKCVFEPGNLVSLMLAYIRPVEGQFHFSYRKNVTVGLSIKDVFSSGARIFRSVTSLYLNDDMDSTFTPDFFINNWLGEIAHYCDTNVINTPLYLGNEDERAANYCVDVTERVAKRYLWQKRTVDFLKTDISENKEWNKKAIKIYMTYFSEEGMKQNRHHVRAALSGVPGAILDRYYAQHPDARMGVEKPVFALPLPTEPGELIELGTCPICVADYDDRHHLPVALLPCGHVICKICERKMFTTQMTRCGYCRKEITGGLRLWIVQE